MQQPPPSTHHNTKNSNHTRTQKPPKQNLKFQTQTNHSKSPKTKIEKKKMQVLIWVIAGFQRIEKRALLAALASF